jgi:cellulose synthase/poly-beta-1,6-N-acetylglucosamine synthase-like glycosyltransferase
MQKNKTSNSKISFARLLPAFLGMNNRETQANAGGMFKPKSPLRIIQAYDGLSKPQRGGTKIAGTAQPFVSIIVPTHRRRDLLKCLLHSLSRLDYSSDRYEVIVIGDTTYDDGTRHLIKEITAAAPFKLSYFGSNAKAPAAKRNLGIKHAKGELIGFTDDDCIADPDWINRVIPHFADLAVAGVQGKTIIPRPDRLDSAFYRAAHLSRPGYQTCNIFYRKKALKEAGGFDERFTESSREDSDLAFTILKRGYKIGYAPAAVIKHPVPKNNSWDLIKSAKRGLSDPLLFKKHPALYRKNIGSVFSRSYKLFYALGAVTMILAIDGDFLPAAFFLFLYLTAFVALAFRQLKGTVASFKELGEFLASFLISPYVLLYSVLAGNLKYRSRLWY